MPKLSDPGVLVDQKREKSKTLDEFTQITDFHRKAVIRLLNGGSRRVAGKLSGRRR